MERQDIMIAKKKYDYVNKQWYKINYQLILKDYGSFPNFEKTFGIRQGRLAQLKRDENKISKNSKLFDLLMKQGYLIKYKKENK